jgi:hypothetical protein
MLTDRTHLLDLPRLQRPDRSSIRQSGIRAGDRSYSRSPRLWAHSSAPQARGGPRAFLSRAPQLMRAHYRRLESDRRPTDGSPVSSFVARRTLRGQSGCGDAEILSRERCHPPCGTCRSTRADGERLIRVRGDGGATACCAQSGAGASRYCSSAVGLRACRRCSVLRTDARASRTAAAFDTGRSPGPARESLDGDQGRLLARADGRGLDRGACLLPARSAISLRQPYRQLG